MEITMDMKVNSLNFTIGLLIETCNFIKKANMFEVDINKLTYNLIKYRNKYISTLFSIYNEIMAEESLNDLTDLDNLEDTTYFNELNEYIMNYTTKAEFDDNKILIDTLIEELLELCNDTEKELSTFIKTNDFKDYNNFFKAYADINMNYHKFSILINLLIEIIISFKYHNN